MKLRKEVIIQKIKIIKSEVVKKKVKIYNIKIYKIEKYLFKLESYYNSIDAVITVTDLKTDREVERRYCKTKSITDSISKVKKEYKKITVSEPQKVLSELKPPVTDYVPEEKIERNYKAETITKNLKFKDCFQELINCLDYNNMVVDLTYLNCNNGRYKIDMIPKSRGMALGLHRVLIDVENKEFKYFHGYTHTSLKLICKTNSISKLFNNEK